MKDATIYFWTKSGNTKIIAETIQEKLKENSIGCELVDISTIDTSQNISVPSEKLLGFMAPIHGFGSAIAFENFLKDFPEGSNDVFFVANGALKVGNAINYAVSKLKSKGYNVVGYTYTLTTNESLVNAKEKENTKKESKKREAPKIVMERAKNKIADFTEKLIQGKKVFEKQNQNIFLMPFLMLAHLLVRALYEPVIKKSLEQEKSEKSEKESKDS